MCICVLTTVCITSLLLPLMEKYGLSNTSIAARREELFRRRHPTSCFRWTSGRGGGPSMAEFHFITQTKTSKYSVVVILSSWETCADPSSGHDPGLGDRSGWVICLPAGPAVVYSSHPLPVGSSFPLRCAAKHHGAM